MPIRDLTGLINAGKRTYGTLADLLQSGALQGAGSPYGAFTAAADRYLTDSQREKIRNTAALAVLPVATGVAGPVMGAIDAGLYQLPELPGTLGQLVQMAATYKAYKGMPAKDWRTGNEITEIRSANGPWAGFFTSDRAVAEKFAKAFEGRDPKQWASKVVTANLQMERPYVVDAAGRPARDFQIDSVNPAHINRELRAAIENPEYDGVIIRNTGDEGTIYIPKDSQQVFQARARRSGSEDARRK
jgi:hypothetical protein